MSNRANVFEGVTLGPEVIPGTAVATTKRLLGTKIMPDIKTDNKVIQPNGSRMITGGVQNKEWTEASISSDPALYTDTVYLLAGLLGPPSISLVSSGVYLSEWDPLNWTALTPKTFTVESGGYVRADKFAYGLVKTLGLEGTRDGVKLSGDMIGQRTTDAITLTPGTNEVQTLAKTGTVSGGTYTISFMGETTTPLNHSDNNATILAALIALPNIASGDVTLGGGALPTTSVTITFGGQYASGNVPLMIVNSASLTGGGTYDITETTPGASMTELGMIPMAGSHWDFYIDPNAAAWGTTKLTKAFQWSFKITDMYDAVWVGNTSNTSWVDHVDIAPKTEFKFRLAGDSTGMGYLTNVRSGDLVFPRIKLTGPTLGGSTYLAQFDHAVEITDIKKGKDEKGVYAVDYTGQIAYDRTSKKYLSYDIRTDIASIA